MCFSLFFHFFICFRREVSRPWHLRKSDAGWLPLAALVSHGVRQLRPTRSLRPSLRGSRRGCSGPVLWNEFSTETSPEKKKPGIRGTDTLNISKSWLRNDLDSYIILYNLIHIYYWYYNVYCYYIYYIYYLPDFFCLPLYEFCFCTSHFSRFRQGVCYHLFGEMHACDLVPSITGNFLLRRRLKRHPGRKDVGSIWLWPVCHEKSPFLIGKKGVNQVNHLFSMGHLYHGYVSHNQRVTSMETYGSPHGNMLINWHKVKNCKRRQTWCASRRLFDLIAEITYANLLLTASYDMLWRDWLHGRLLVNGQDTSFGTWSVAPDMFLNQWWWSQNISAGSTLDATDFGPKVGRSKSFSQVIIFSDSKSYPLVNQHSYWKWPFIVALPMKNGDFP